MAALHYLPSLGASRALACCLCGLFFLKEKTTKDTQPSMKCCCQEAGKEKFPTPVGKFYVENYRNLCPIPWTLLPSVRQLSLEKIKSKKRERKRSRSAVNTFQVHLTWFKSGRPHFCGDKSPGNSRWKDMHCVCAYMHVCSMLPFEHTVGRGWCSVSALSRKSFYYYSILIFPYLDFYK